MSQDFMQQFNTVENAEIGATLHFLTPKGELAFVGEGKGKAMTVTMQGASGSLHKSLMASEVRKSRVEMKKNRNKKSEDKEFTTEAFEEIAKEQVTRLVAVVTSWENFFDDGKPMKCTKENVALIFGKYQALRVQAIAFLDNDVNFIQS